MDKMTMILAIEFCAIKGRNKMMPSSVRIEAIKDRTEKNCSSNNNSSISNHVRPGPGLGIARNIKIIMAVPMIISRWLSGKMATKRLIKNKIMPTDPANTISCA